MSEVDAAVELLAAARRVVVACHVNPDGDALGSALGLALALATRGVDARVGFGSTDTGPGGHDVPRTLAFLPGQHLIAPPDELAALTGIDVLVAVDTGSADRLGPLAPLIASSKRSLVIDHHASNTGFGSDRLIDPAAASTTVLVERVVAGLGVPLDADIATCLYVGLVTDTGQFQFRATTPAVHELAATLLAAGVDPEPIGRAIYGTSPYSAMVVQGAAMARARLERGLVWTWIDAAERAAAGVPLADVEGVIDGVRVAAEAEVAVVLKGVDATTWLVSTRSRGAVDVGAACVSLGGGGHRYAAGATLSGSVDEVMAQVREALAAVTG